MRTLKFVSVLAMLAAGCQSQDAAVQVPNAKPPAANQEMPGKAPKPTSAKEAAPPGHQQTHGPQPSDQNAERLEYIRQVRVVLGDMRSVAAAITGDVAEVPRRVRALNDSIDRLPDPPAGDATLATVPKQIREIRGDVGIAESVVKFLAVAGNTPGPEGRLPLDRLAEIASQLRDTCKEIEETLRR